MGVSKSELAPAIISQLMRVIASPTITPTAISKFMAAANSVTSGVDVTFNLTGTTGISAVTLLRNFSMDPATATALQTWAPRLGTYTWADSDKALQANGEAFYWIVLSPQGTTGTAITTAPQTIVLNPQLLPPVTPTAISASSGTLVSGTVKITVNVAGYTGSVKIYASGYHATTSEVAVASSASAPLQFTLAATGETVTLEAVGVSAGGAETPSGPTTTVTLNGTATIPAQVQGVVVTQIPAGNQINWPSSRDAGSTYKLYRAQRGQTFLLATLLATVTGTAGTLDYLDTAGLTGDWAYFVVATNSVGDSLPSATTSPAILLTSASMPANTPANTSNTAVVDSVDAGTSTLVRIYGSGGVGTSYLRRTGYGSGLARPNGTISGLGYSQSGVVLWTGTTYVFATNYPATLPDSYEPVGGLTTTVATGTSGSGATLTLVIDTGGHVIQANETAPGSLYAAASVNISGGGGSGAQVQANVASDGTIPSYTVLNGGTGYATVPAAVVVAGTGSSTGGGGATGTSAGSRTGIFTRLPGF